MLDRYHCYTRPHVFTLSELVLGYLVHSAVGLLYELSTVRGAAEDSILPSHRHLIHGKELGVGSGICTFHVR